jgi:hypothetical protein
VAHIHLKAPKLRSSTWLVLPTVHESCGRAIPGSDWPEICSLPKQATLYRFFWQLEEQMDEVEASLSAWAKAVLKALGKEEISISLDGKYLRGSLRQRKGERALLLLPGFIHELGFSLWQGKVDSAEDDSAVTMLTELEGLEEVTWLITGDAGLASAKVTKKVVAKKGATCLP